ncbi:AI-2E family transporter [Microcella indica]|uniref:AI-2E family transporter n=1 Tax=Microcella indica TaxID=2750620 RepID=UPI0015CF762B|nr:AI-2E family transporter [Microcella indica]MBU1250440.1 AI-2E family transporter [Actinomycetota bacterium]MBU1610116.1 AI-2E family transporter [Actinomycetota bacterium]MBU2315516.1 AI-2E family transporter [Actinomycetota bacterium]MBU2385317.1 AI-2E family transporter [Actinomycetota bacterium]
MFRAFRSAEQSSAPAVSTVPPGVRIASEWSWRFLAIAGAAGVLIFLIIQLRLLVIPLFIGVLLAALLVPYASWLGSRLRFPRWLAILTAMLTLIAVVGGLVWLVVSQVRAGYGSLEERSVERYADFLSWLSATFELSDAELATVIDDTVAQLDLGGGWLVSGALSVGSTLTEVLTGSVLVLFAVLFFLIDGRRIWQFVVGLFPRRARTPVDGAGRAGWLTLTNFVKVQIFVAFVDAVGIGLGAVILQLPLALPIAVAVFLGAFVPIVGAVVTGALAVFVALIYYDIVIALIMLGIVLLVQQIEGNVLQPLVMGTAVKVHPLAVVLAVAAGGFLAGIPGTLFAVPIVAVLNVVVRYLSRGQWRTNPRPSLADVIAPHDHDPPTTEGRA